MFRIGGTRSSTKKNCNWHRRGLEEIVLEQCESVAAKVRRTWGGNQKVIALGSNRCSANFIDRKGKGGDKRRFRKIV